MPVLTRATKGSELTFAEMDENFEHLRDVAAQTSGSITGLSVLETNNLILPKTSGSGIQLDLDVPSYGWKDLTAEIIARGTGAADPAFNLYGATIFRAYEFSATVEQEVFMTFHVPHDYLPGSDFHFHVHWSNATGLPNTGDVVWGFDYSIAKGHDQQAFPAFTSITVVQASSAVRYQHQIAETTAITSTNMEPDSLILLRVYRKAADVLDTCTDVASLHTADIHYRTTGLMGTKQKTPNFYV